MYLIVLYRLQLLYYRLHSNIQMCLQERNLQGETIQLICSQYLTKRIHGTEILLVAHLVGGDVDADAINIKNPTPVIFNIMLLNAIICQATDNQIVERKSKRRNAALLKKKSRIQCNTWLFCGTTMQNSLAYQVLAFGR